MVGAARGQAMEEVANPEKRLGRESGGGFFQAFFPTRLHLPAVISAI